MKHVTIRNLPPDLAEALEREKRQRNRSLNQTVIDLLRQAVGLVAGARRSNGLGGLGGGWTAKELEEFEAATAVTEQIDEELWR